MSGSYNYIHLQSQPIQTPYVQSGGFVSTFFTLTQQPSTQQSVIGSGYFSRYN